MIETKEGMTRREREREGHRQEILKVAEEVFSAYGFEGTTIEMVARQAEFSVGSIYNFFKGKEDLFRQVFLTVSHQRIQSIHEAVTPVLGEPWVALRALSDCWIDYYVSHGEFLRTALSAILAGGTKNRPEGPPPTDVISVFKNYYEEVLTVFRVLVKDPDARPFDPTEAVVVSEGTVREFLKYHTHDPETGIPHPLPETIHDDLYHLLCSIFRK